MSVVHNISNVVSPHTKKLQISNGQIKDTSLTAYTGRRVESSRSKPLTWYVSWSVRFFTMVLGQLYVCCSHILHFAILPFENISIKRYGTTNAVSVCICHLISVLVCFRISPFWLFPSYSFHSNNSCMGHTIWNPLIHSWSKLDTFVTLYLLRFFSFA